MTDHKYKVGQTVRVVRSAKDGAYPVPGGKFNVTGLLPSDGAENPYRLKSALDGHERGVTENRLET